MQMIFTKETIECMQREFLADKLIEIGAVDCDERNNLLNTPSETLQSWIIDRLEELNELYIKSNAKLKEENERLNSNIEKMKCCENCKNEGDYKEPYRYGTGWCNICKRHKVAKGNFDKWEIKEK